MQDLSKTEVCFYFIVQFREDSKEQPLENTSIEWKSAFHTIATLKIPIQNFDTADRRAAAGTMQFNPWNGLTEHRLLGAINRIRKEVYSVLSAYGLAKENK